MSRKLLFQVIHVSGSDENHPGKELEVHGPTSKGWQSSRFCVFPQEIVICLKEPSKITKIQILSHQYNIASKIEMFIAYRSSDGSKSLNGLKFRRLGYVPLSENEATNFKARELKSVHLDADGQFIKLLVHKNYVNKVNLYNQVCIVAINIIGQSLLQQSDNNANYICRTEDLISSYMSNEESPLNNVPQARYEGGKFVSPLDDLAFDMYQDPETAQLIRRLEEKKRQAVLEERFDYAKKLKQAMADLYKVGEKLGKFEVDKRRAVEMEDYELAKSKKIQSDEYRLYVYKQLDVFDLLELNQKSKYERAMQEKKVEFEVNHTHQLQQQHQQQLQHEPSSPPAPITTHNTENLTLPPVPTSSIVAQTSSISVAVSHNDERPLPALQGKSITLPEEPDIPDVPEESNEDDAGLGTLSEKEEREASIIIDIFGMMTARKLFSKSWKYRQESISCFSDELSNPTERSVENSPSRISRAIVAALKKGMKDQVYVVLQDSVELLKKLMLEYIPEKGLNKTELARTVEKLLPIILKRTSDSVPRSRNMMFDTAVEVANSKAVKELNVVPSIICEPIKNKNKAPWRQMKSQIDVIKALIPDLGVDNKNGFLVDNVMDILKEGLQHANSMVRDSSLECIMELYKLVKEPLKKHFPPDDANSRKNPLYVKLYDGFDKIDGKLTFAERKAEASRLKEETEKKQETEVKALQAQLEQLRTMAQQQVKENENTTGEGEKSETNVEVDENKPVAKVEEKKAPKEPMKPVKSQTPRKDLVKPEMERLCIFCGEKNETFTDEQLDVHYWKSCPMLKRCHSCTEVVEISEMTEHLMTECEHKDKYMECKLCGVVITKAEETSHIQTKQCQDIKLEQLRGNKESGYRCPLCQVPVAEGDENWKRHLIDNCQINSERLQKAAEGKKVAPKVGRGRGRGRGRGGTQAARGRGRGISKIPSKATRKK